MSAPGTGQARAGTMPHGRSDMQEKQQKGAGRRNLLRAAAGASVAPGLVMLIPTEAYAYDPGQQERRARYRETEHVKAFYRVNGYQTLKTES
jgi:hypothetical protein